MTNRRLIDAGELLKWLGEIIKAHIMFGQNERVYAYKDVKGRIMSGAFDPNPTIKQGDTTTIKFNCRECDFECVVQYDSEVFVDIDKGHCPHCGNADAVDLEVISHD